MKAQMHTPFAVLAATVLLTLFLIPLNSVPDTLDRNTYATTFEDYRTASIQASLEEAAAESAANYIEKANKEVVDQGFLNNAENSIEYSKGEFNGSDISFTNFTELHGDLKKALQAQGTRYTGTGKAEALEPGLKVNGTAEVDYRTVLNANYSYSGEISGKTGLRGPDPLLTLRTGEDHSYRYCGFDRPFRKLATGTGGDTAWGHAYSGDPGEAPSGDLIFVTENASKYSSDQLDQFNGVISEKASVPSGDYADASYLEVELPPGASVILHEGDVWRSHARKAIENGCYLENSEAPGVYNRMENSTSSSPQGIVKLIDTADSNPSEAYLNASTISTGLNEVPGVTWTDYGDERPGFRLSDRTVQAWQVPG